MLSGKPQCGESELPLHVVTAMPVIYFWRCHHHDDEGQGLWQLCRGWHSWMAGGMAGQTQNCSPSLSWLAWVCPRCLCLSSPAPGSTGVTQEEAPNPLPAWSSSGPDPGSFPGMVPRSHHCCGQEDCGGSWHLPGSGVPVLRGWEVGKGLALSTGSVVVFLALEILLSFSSSCWDQAQLALSPGCLLTAAGGSVRGPGVAEEGSSAPGGSQCHLLSKSPSLEVMWVSLPLITPWGTQEFWSPCVTHVAVG